MLFHREVDGADRSGASMELPTRQGDSVVPGGMDRIVLADHDVLRFRFSDVIY